MGLEVELEHGRRDPSTNVSDDDQLITGKIAWAHLNEFRITTRALQGWKPRRNATGPSAGRDKAVGETISRPRLHARQRAER
jgi:hypothetical protein